MCRVQNHFLPSDPPEPDGLDGSVSGTIDFFGDNQDVLAPQVQPGHYNDPEWVLAGVSGQWMPDYRPKHAPYENETFVLTPSQTTTQCASPALPSLTPLRAARAAAEHRLAPPVPYPLHTRAKS